jgi:hypothetical protein
MTLHALRGKALGPKVIGLRDSLLASHKGDPFICWATQREAGMPMP